MTGNRKAIFYITIIFCIQMAVAAFSVESIKQIVALGFIQVIIFLAIITDILYKKIN
jgi:hypothetical protein